MKKDQNPILIDDEVHTLPSLQSIPSGNNDGTAGIIGGSSYSGHWRNHSFNSYNLLSANMNGYHTNNSNMSAIMAENDGSQNISHNSCCKIRW